MSRTQRGALPLALLIAALCVFITSAGCGDQDSPAPPSTDEARATVLAYLRAAESGEFTRACELLSPGAQATVRTDALGSLAPIGRTDRERRRAVQGAFTQASTCEGAVELRAGQLKDDLPRIARVAKSTPLESLDQTLVAIGQDQDWLIRRMRDQWVVDGVNGFSPNG